MLFREELLAENINRQTADDRCEIWSARKRVNRDLIFNISEPDLEIPHRRVEDLETRNMRDDASQPLRSLRDFSCHDLAETTYNRRQPWSIIAPGSSRPCLRKEIIFLGNVWLHSSHCLQKLTLRFLPEPWKVCNP